MLKKLLFILLFTTPIVSFSQNVPIGEWRDHLPYSDAVSVSLSEDFVYCATSSAVFVYDKTENTIDRLNLVNGLSDIGLSKIKYNPQNGKVIITYLNGNIDILDENKNITNLSFIKNSTIAGGKIINHIYFKGKFAYLSTGFGIVVLDTEKLEVKDTYLFGPLGSFVVTNAVTMDNLNIYAATDQGVFYADKNSTTLIDYNSWSLLPDLGTKKYNNITTFNNQLFASYDSPVWNSDTVYYNNTGVWQKFIPAGLNVENLSVSNNKLVITLISKINIYNDALTLIDGVFTYNGSFSITPQEVVIDADNTIWYAEKTHGLIKTKNNWTNEQIFPNGPSSSNVFGMDILNEDLWVVSGGQNIFLNANLVNHKTSDKWEKMPPTFHDANGNNALDMVSVAINPRNSSNVYIGSWSSGLYEYNNNEITAIFNAQNSDLDSSFFGSTALRAIQFDKNSNLWITNSFANDILTVKTSDNNWYSYSFPGLTKTTDYYRDIIVDKNNYKWITIPLSHRILVFDDNATPSNTNDDIAVLLTSNPGSIFSSLPAYDPHLPGSSIYSIKEDLDGEIWVGTDEGIAVFYNSTAVFDDEIKAEQIFLQQDGQTQVLLETEIITTIEIDGANRKWIGTQNSGVFLMSEDGTEEIEHFTTKNSPLFSNNIFDIVINNKTGEVFFGTEKGILSYKGTATEANKDFSDVFVYPNPVKPDFKGPIAIRGLVKDTDVRITDISGNIVYQTTSLGGQAIWDGKDLNGKKVQTGVYMIFNGSAKGTLKAAAKILIYH